MLVLKRMTIQPVYLQWQNTSMKGLKTASQTTSKENLISTKQQVNLNLKLKQSICTMRRLLHKETFSTWVWALKCHGNVYFLAVTA